MKSSKNVCVGVSVLKFKNKFMTLLHEIFILAAGYKIDSAASYIVHNDDSIQAPVEN